MENNEIEKLNLEFKKYLEFKNSEEYDEKYKFEFFETNQVNFLDYIDNFEEKFKEIRKKSGNLVPRKLRDYLLPVLWNEARDDFIRIFKYLYDEDIEISKRIIFFEKELYESMKKTSRKNLDFAKLGFGETSFLLALYDYKKYLFINPVTPFNKFTEDFSLDKNLYKKGNNGERYKNWLDLSKNILIPELSKIKENASILDIQDFIFCTYHSGYKNDEEMEKLEKRIGELGKFYENKDDKFLSFHYEKLKYLFENFAKNGRYFSVVKNSTDRKQFFIFEGGGSSAFLQTNFWNIKLEMSFHLNDGDNISFWFYPSVNKLKGFLENNPAILGKKFEKDGKNFRLRIKEEDLLENLEEINKIIEENNIGKKISKENFIKDLNNRIDEIIGENNKNFWLYAPGENAINWEEEKNGEYISIGWDELGNLSEYKTKEEINKKYIEIYGKKSDSNILANWEFANDIKIGDTIFVKKGIKKILGYGTVTEKYFYDEKSEKHKSKIGVKWVKIKEIELEDMEKINMKNLVLKTLTKITSYPYLVNYILEKFSENNQKIMTNKFQTETELLSNKKQIILYGPPGTGKTYNVKNIIKEHSGGENYEDLQKSGRVEFITFHQSFSYEEFIEGIKPDLDGTEINYEIKPGIFKEICDRAKTKNSANIDEKIEWLKEKLSETDIEINENTDFILKYRGGKTFKFSPKSSKYPDVDYPVNIENIIKLYKGEFGKSDVYNSSYAIGILEYLYKNGLKRYDEIEEKNNKNYYLVIDEINRGNISKIFGELITLLEADKRIGGENQLKTKLPYSKKEFGVPENLYIIATMNTSDKSIVSLDTALRRRFGFVEMLPNYEVLNKYQEENIDFKEIKLSELLKKLNSRIEYLLDKDHLIGHSYFMKVENLADLKKVFLNEIYPLLEEYFYGEEENIRKVLGNSFFEKKNIDKNLFGENNSDSDYKIEDDEIKYEIKKEISEEDFEGVLRGIIGE